MTGPHGSTDPVSRATPFKLGRLATELQWQSLLRTLPVAVYMTDPEGWITFHNDAAVRLWGVRPEIGKARYNGAWKLFRPDGTPLPHSQTALAQTLRAKRPVLGLDTIAERPDGSRVHFIPYPAPLFSAAGELTGAVNILIDITERHRAELTAQRLAAIVESSDDAILAKDLEGTITSWNGGAQRLFGYAAEEMIGKPILILVPLDRRDEEALILARLRAGERIDHLETVRRRRDGSLVEVSLSVSPVRDANGRIVGASTIVRDITEQRRAQERQEMLLREMNHRVKNLFALTGAVVNLSGRSSSTVEQLVEAVQGRLGALSRAHELTLADLDRRKASTPTTLHALIRTIVSPYEDLAGQRVSVSGPDVPIEGHAVTGLALVFHELATNAAKYGALSVPGGQVEINSATNADRLDLSWVERGGPPVASAPKTAGFGTRLLDSTIKGQLQGSLTRRWRRSGLGIRITLPLSAPR
ncbi:PAS domain S-box protein [Inquilinus sp. Marseille-Q2685]|uniref:PAS domain S-box protein n=1 Tax=Inquilinus sp. Marseille-Q2685 TaxID=2866581 RepID=UPI001CE49F3C|nr:PAS domain S-box protein [Inquilinus sp. Marseille-Q2685]